MEQYVLIAAVGLAFGYVIALTFRIKTRPKPMETTPARTEHGYEICSIELSSKEMWRIIWDGVEGHHDHPKEWDTRVGRMGRDGGCVITYYRPNKIARDKLWLVKG